MKIAKLVGGAMLGLCVAPSVVFSQEHIDKYPSKPLRMVLPYPAGGPTDLVGRLLGAKLAMALGKPVVVENRGGGGGVVGTTYAAHAAQDGYTLYLGGISALAIAPALRKQIGYDVSKDFRPVSLATRQPTLLVVSKTIPVSTVEQFVTYAKQHPGEINFGSSGVGSSGHLAGEMFAQQQKIDIVHVPYLGGAAVFNAMRGGEVQAAFVTAMGTSTLMKSGDIKGVAITGKSRSKMFPELPTFTEQGMKDYDATAFNGILVPTGTSQQVIAKLNRELTKILKSPDVIEKLGADGSLVSASTPDEFESLIKSEQAKWADVVKASGTSID